MIGKAPTTEAIINLLSGISELYQKSLQNAFNPLRRKYYKEISDKIESARRERKRVKDALWLLKKAEAITYNKQDSKYNLTIKGWLKFLHYYNKSKPKQEKTNSSEKYLIIFDIPEKHRRFRNLFRQCLYNLNCELVQKSVFQTKDPWVFNFAKKIVSNCDLDGHVKFVEAKKIY